MMRTFLINIMLALAWAALMGEFSEVNLLAGFIFGYFMLWVMQFVLHSSNYGAKVGQIIRLTVLFFKELVIANLRVAYSVLAPYSSMQPAIMAIPLDITSDEEIMTLANMITLTPGTMSIDVSDDRKVLYVHGMHVFDLEEAKQDIKNGFERVVQEVFES